MTQILPSYKYLVLTRGIPGSGKTTAVDNLVCQLRVEDPESMTFGPSVSLVSADYFHGSPYKFQRDNLSKAHVFCQLTAEAHIRNNINYVIVDNTNVRRIDYAPYLFLAKKYYYTVKFLLPNTPWSWDVDECFKRNVHGVPRETIQRMKDQFEEDNEFERIYLP